MLRYINGGTPTPRQVMQAEILPRMLGSDEHSDGLGFWAAIERSTGDFLGWFCLHTEEGGPPDIASLGYRLRRSAWGKGYGTEGARALIRRGFTQLGLRSVTATTYELNAASRRVMEKAGMKRIRTYHSTPEQIAAAGTFVPAAEVWEGDDVEYAIDRAAWERLEAGASDEMSGDRRPAGEHIA